MDFVYAVNVCVNRGSDNVSACGEAIENMSFILHLHVHLAAVIGTLADTLDGKLVDGNLALHYLAESIDGGIHRTVSGSRSLEFLPGDIQAY